MSELLAAALRMMAPAHPAPEDEAPDGWLGPLPAALSYAECVRRFDPGADAVALVTRANALAHVLCLQRTLETLNGFPASCGTRGAARDSDHLYQAHGDPRD